MKKMLAVIVLLCVCGSAFADLGYVGPYYRRDGTYVSGHLKDTSGDGNPYNNRRYILGY